ncbi:hypothetical protein GJAV_G00136400 [Gymnothorax javanicus]|nr:hypothetical protein GJAV_G00136400 [Gymnothorax javanicus]
MLNFMCLRGSGTLSLWGKKVDFMDWHCNFWKLNTDCTVPALEDVSVCVSLWKRIQSPQWTAFVYKKRGDEEVELGLMGTERKLRVFLFGEVLSTLYTLPLRAWHTVCLTWSGHHHRLRVYVNHTRILKAQVDGHDRSRHLLPGGILTLGVSHSYNGKEIEVETGSRFQGDVSLFRMWGEERSHDQLKDLSCTEGDVVHWSALDWNVSSCQPVSDAGLKCAWSFFEIKMTVHITSWDGNTTNIQTAEGIVSDWLWDILPSRMTVDSVSASFSSYPSSRDRFDMTQSKDVQERRGSRISPVISHFDFTVHLIVIPECDVSEVQTEVFQLLSLQYSNFHLRITMDTSRIIIRPVEYLPSTTGPPVQGSTETITQGPMPGSQDIFYRVNLNVTVSSKEAYEPGHVIQIWLFTALSGNQMSILNFRLLIGTNSQMELKTPKLETTLSSARMKSYSCTFQVQVNTSLDVAQTAQQIQALLKPDFSIGLITMHADSIQITHIEPGSCPEHSQQTRQGFYMWPATKAQCKATLPCDCEDCGHTASRVCELDSLTERAKWTTPDLKSCPFIVKSIMDLCHIRVTQNNSVDVVHMMLNLTSKQTELSELELNIVLNKLMDVMEVSQVTPSLGKAMVQVIADILESDSNLSPVTNRILNITEDIGDRMSFSEKLYNMYTEPLAISLVNVDPDQFDGITFGVSSDSQDLKIFVNDDPIKGTEAFVSLPREVETRFPQQDESSVRIQFHFYRTLQLFEDTQHEKELNTYVASASVTNATIRDLEQQVVVTLRHLKPARLKDTVECVFWNFNKNGSGGWDSSGCSMHNTSIYYTTCVCDHLTHFGVLLDVSRTPVSEENETILTIISYLGCGISSLFLGVSLLTYLAFEKLRGDYPSKILMNLSLALLGLNLVFLLNSWLSSFTPYSLCISTAAFLHYFLLASFTWMGLEAVHMYFALVKVFNVYVPSYILKFCIVGWGLPLVVVSLVLAVKMDAYGSSVSHILKPRESTELFCWLQDDVVFYVTVVAYILLILLCNSAVFMVVLVQIHNMHANKPAGSRHGLLHDLRGVASLTFLLGLTWMLAFFGWGPAKLPLLYLFSLLNSLQGFFIFVFHCLLKENVRKQWRAHLCCGALKLKEHSDWSQTATFGVKSRVNHLIRTPSVKSARSDHSNSTSHSSVSAQRLISTRRSDPDPFYSTAAGRDVSHTDPVFLHGTEVVYEKPLALPRARCGTPPVPPEGISFPGQIDCGIPSWSTRNGFQ